VRSLDETLAGLEEELRSVEQALADPDVASDLARLRDLSKRHKELAEINEAWRELTAVRDDLATAKEMFNDSDGADREAWREEVAAAEEKIPALEDRLETLLLPRDPNEGRNVIMEIRGAEGGEEANLFAGDLADMYRRYFALHGWKFDVLEESVSDQGGLDEVIFLIKGEDAWTRLEHEAGVHRVQRVPATEAKGRVHTSSATVSVLPEAEEVDVEINPNELKIDVYRSSGPGGQSVNTTDSAVRITHIPTGLVVSQQDQKSQLQNKLKGMEVLRARLLDLRVSQQEAERSKMRKSQVSTGDRSAKIRTYNWPQSRVTDHRINFTTHNLPGVMNGEIGPLIEAVQLARLEEDMGDQ